MKKIFAALAMCALLGACTPKEEKKADPKDATDKTPPASQPSGDMPADKKK